MRGFEQLPAVSLTGSALHSEAIVNESMADRRMAIELTKNECGVNQYLLRNGTLPI